MPNDNGSSADTRLPTFRDFIPEILDGLLGAHRNAPFDDFDVSRVFSYWIAELFETTDPGSFSYTDGGRELGIDFFVADGDNYYIYQCKAVTLETLESAVEAPSFDADDVNHLVEGIEYLRDESSSFPSTKREIRELRTRYQRSLKDSPTGTDLVATLAVLGKLTPGGRERFESVRQSYLAHGVALRLIEWPQLFEAIHRLDSQPSKTMRIDLRVDDKTRDILYQQNWIYALVYASDLVDAFEKHGMQLFDLNVRSEIRGSKVNRAIVDSLGTSQGRKNFHHLNNGLLLVCNNYRLPRSDGEPVRIQEPQIVNGCQTVTSLWRAYTDLSPEEQHEFRKGVKVQAKVIQQVAQDLLDEVVITTNNQNPMRARNLRSNSREQRDIQRGFRELKDKWFYVRKDGEFESLLNRGRPVAWFRKKDYEVQASGGRPRYRRIDNESVAKAWYSWIGNSGRAVQGGTDYFGEDAIYKRVFQVRPSHDYWHAFKEPEFERPDEGLFEPLSPTAHQLLLAQSVSAFVRSQVPSAIRNRRESISRLVKSGKIPGERDTGQPRAAQAQIAKALAEDREYVVTGYLSNIENILVELFGFVLCLRYGSLGPSTSRKLLALPDLATWTRLGFSLGDSEYVQDSSGVLWRVLEFVKWSLKHYFANFRFEIEAASRPKMFFARRESIVEMRKVLLESDDMCRETATKWKPQDGEPFVAGLPDLRA